MKKFVCAALRFVGLCREPQTEDTERLWYLYFDIGLDYHVAARFAFVEQFNPIVGNLFHHAIEMYLKGALCRTHDEYERRRLGHRLTKIWKRFKVENPDRYERIRYPEEILRKGMISSINFSRAAVPSPSTVGSRRPEPRYDLFVDELDALAKEIFLKASVNGKAFTSGMRQGALNYLQNQNQSSFW
jgi:HEPN domain-containing protein